MAALIARTASKRLCYRSILASPSSLPCFKSFSTDQTRGKSRSTILGEHWEELEEEFSLDRADADPPKSRVESLDDAFVGVRGHSSVIDKADFAHARIGDVLEIPYEVTASDFWREMWQSVFYQQDRIHTSIEYVNSLREYESKKVGVVHDSSTKGIPIPFSQMLYAATSMAHVDDTRNVLDLSFRNCIYERAVFPNDTLQRHFVIENIRESSNHKNILIDLKCKMYNQHNELVFRLEKTMFFEKLALSLDGRDVVKLSQSSKKGIAPVIDTRSNESSAFKKYLLKQGSKAHSLTVMNPYSIKKIYKDELMLHTLQRPIGMETNMNLSMLFRMTHPLLYNTNRYRDPGELYVGGVLLIALTHSIASKELYEVIYEELLDSHIINKASPNDCISAMTYVIDVNDDKYEYFQEVECITIGLKNVDITAQLNNLKIPLSLFRPGIFPRDVENICNKFMPQLSNKIVVHSYRKLLRHKPKHDTMIPLL
mmetsp:Transcript_61186/g.97357  ORF Transcript_61186/g.97357 Transcript_61186/m.97357 type:complete len:484 (+) Transcript_61186:800-2251(+)